MPMPVLDLAADIGGTNARFALSDPAAATPALLQPQALPGEAFATLEDAARHYLAAVDVQPRRAAIALACPVSDGEIRLTNRAWSFRRDTLRAALGLDELLLLNDFGAVAHAVPALRARDRVALHGDADAVLTAPVSVLGPGTGLGVALLAGSGAEGWIALETEGGHATFAPVDDQERAIARHIDALHGRTSCERVLSGDGLSCIDAVLRGGEPGPRDPAAIVAAALDGSDPVAERTLAQFCAILGSVAGDIALIHGARAVVIAGGIVPRFLPFLRASAFRERFLAKGRFASHLEPLPVQVITHPHPGLLGAAMALRRPLTSPR